MENLPPTTDAPLQHARRAESIKQVSGPQVKFLDLYQSPGAGLGMNVTKNGHQSVSQQPAVHA